MNQEQNNDNLNSQGSNIIPNNQSLNTTQIMDYNSQTGQTIYANQNQPQVNTNMYQQQYVNQNNNSTKKKKIKWWIPILFFVGGFLMFLGNFIATIIVTSQQDLVLESDLLKNPIIMLFRWLTIICWIMVIPSLIIVIINYNKKTPEEKIQNDFQINNMINNATSLHEKLLIAYIGNNYDQIIQKKFSIPALFLSWIYTLYRKIYIPSIIGMVATIFLGFLPNPIYSIMIFAFVIVLGINFNKWYIAYAKKQVNKIISNNQNVSETVLINICKEKGGTNIWAAIAIYTVFVIISSALNPNISVGNDKLNINIIENTIALKVKK